LLKGRKKYDAARAVIVERKKPSYQRRYRNKNTCIQWVQNNKKPMQIASAFGMYK